MKKPLEAIEALLPAAERGGLRVVHPLAASRRMLRFVGSLVSEASATVSGLRLASVKVAAGLEVGSVVTKMLRVVIHPTLNSSRPPSAAA